jgi:hypothetical protein
MEEREAQIFGKGAVFSAESDSGWVPPGKRDVVAIEADSLKEHY